MACEVWRDVEASLISEMKAMPEENRRLKRMYADVTCRMSYAQKLVTAIIRRRFEVA